MPHPSLALRRPRRLNDAAVRRPAGFAAAAQRERTRHGGRGGTLSFLVEDDEDATLPWLTCQRGVAIGGQGRAVELGT